MSASIGPRINIVCIGQNDTLDIPKRDVQLMRALARQPQVARVLFVEPAFLPWIELIKPLLIRHISPTLWRRLTITLRQPLRSDPDILNLFYFRSFALLGYQHYFVHAPALRRHYGRWLVRRLNNLIEHLDMQEHLVLWLYLPLAGELMGQLGEISRCYDHHDDHRWHPRVIPSVACAIEQGYADLLSGCDLVFVASPRATNWVRQFNDQVHLLPSGVDNVHFRLASEGRLALPADLAGLPRPIIGYVGVIQERVDLELIAQIATAHPEWSLALVGHVFSHVDLSLLANYPNVHVLGMRDYAEIPRYIQAFSVAVLPHRVDAVTDHMSPIKLYEYLATGKPVVATPVAGTEELDGLIQVAEPGQMFISALERALADDNPVAAAVRVRCAQKHSWEQRANQVLIHLIKALSFTSRSWHYDLGDDDNCDLE